MAVDGLEALRGEELGLVGQGEEALDSQPPRVLDGGGDELAAWYLARF